MKINTKRPPSMCDKIKLVHTKGSDFTKTKKQQPNVLFRSSPIVPVEISQDNKRKYGG
jgi:hypothetical protein